MPNKPPYEEIGQSLFVLTMDTDWAPQFVIDTVLDLLDDYKVQATMFCTSSYEMSERNNIECALHPNFMPDSTQGNTEEEVLYRMKRMWPQAVGSRSHRFYWHSGLMNLLVSHGISYDSSQLMFLHPHLKPMQVLELTRFPVWWGDGMHLHSGLSTSCFAPPGLEEPGLKICLFHPIHIYLNTQDLSHYRAVVQTAGEFREARPTALKRFQKAGAGIRTVFEDFLHYVSRQGTSTCLRDLAKTCQESSHDRI